MGKKLQENAKINTRNQSASIKNLETQIEQLTKEFHTKVANDISSSSVDQYKAMYTEEKTPINDKQHEISIVSNKFTQIVQENVATAKVLLCQLPPKEINPKNFTLPCTIGSLSFYAMTDLGASVNVIPKSMFEHLKLDRLKKTDMLVEMENMTKRSLDGIVENVLVKIDKFLFLLDFVVMDMLNTCNETMILGRPFLATIHAEIDVFNKEISLGIGGDRVTFDMDKKIHNFTTPIGEIYMINATSNTPSDASSTVEETNDVDNENSHETYRTDEEGVLRKWYCYDDNDMNGINKENQEKGLVWDNRFEEWCNNNPNAPTSKFTSIYKNLNPRPKDYPFKDWLLTKVGHTNVSETVKKTLLKTWLIDYFQEDVVKDQRERSFDDYKWMFDLEIDKLADEYKLGVGKKGQMLEDIWENCKKVQGDNTYWWHDQKSEKEESRELGIYIKEYDPPMDHVETFEVKKYSFDAGQNFICVTNDLMDALPLGRENGSRFRDMISKEVDSGRRIRRKT
ncbi:reverse transcriptase domain-containing protein [Tanacetum coccineum]